MSDAHERQRLERLMAMLAAERAQGRDLRAEVLRRLQPAMAARRRRRVLWSVLAVGALMVSGWLGVQSWRSAGSATDLGEFGRRGARWLLPSDPSPARVTPVRYVPRPKREPMAVAPWGRT